MKKRFYLAAVLLPILCFLAAGYICYSDQISTELPQNTGKKVQNNSSTVWHSENVGKSITNNYLVLVNKWHRCERTSDLCCVFNNKNSSYYVKDKMVKLSNEVIPSLNKMMKECAKENLSCKVGVISGYRSADYQSKLYDNAVNEQGQDYADHYVARPGFSEHETGYAIDFGAMNNAGENVRFANTSASEWMLNNSYRYGFIRRYPEDKEQYTGIALEPWHYRFVGVKAATYMKEHNLCLEEYLKR